MIWEHLFLLIIFKHSLSRHRPGPGFPRSACCPWALSFSLRIDVAMWPTRMGDVEPRGISSPWRSAKLKAMGPCQENERIFQGHHCVSRWTKWGGNHIFFINHIIISRKSSDALSIVRTKSLEAPSTCGCSGLGGRDGRHGRHGLFLSKVCTFLSKNLRFFYVKVANM